MLKLIGFKHMDAEYVERHFCSLACNEGSIGLAFELKRQAAVNAVVDPVKRQTVLDRARIGDAEGDEGLIDFDDEVQDLVLILPMMFNVGLTTFHWCFQCKNVSSVYECGCPERRGIEGINWDGFGPEYVSPVYHYEIRMQSLKPVIVHGYQGALTAEQIIQNILERYRLNYVDHRFLFLFGTLRKFAIPDPGETVQFAYDTRTVGHIRCWR